jgi:hypothetical protein
MFRSLLHTVFVVVFASLLAAPSLAQEYKVEKLDQKAPDDIAPEIAALLQPSGYKFIKGESRTVCELWFCKEWPVSKDFKVTAEVNYPFTPGQVIGVARYPRKGRDFRDQDILAGVYVLRYSQQPVDGAHVGTSPTRDFLALLPAAKDHSPDVLEYKPLVAAAKETTGATHPAILSLQRQSDSSEDLEVRHNEEKDWYILRFKGKAVADSKASDLAIEFVVVGHAAE